MSDTCQICLHDLSPHPLGEKNGYKLISCKYCGSAMTDPWPTAEELEKFFAEIEPEATHVQNHQDEVLAASKLIEKTMPEYKGRRFLDIGCRNGYAVTAAKSLGMEAKGIDQHDFFIRFTHAKYDASLFEEARPQDLPDDTPKADFIYCVERYCEEQDPDAMTAALAKLLAPGGVIYLEEPDGNHFNVHRHFPSWPIVFPLLNFSYPSKKGMEIMLKRHGLKIKKSFFSWQPRMRLIITQA